MVFDLGKVLLDFDYAKAARRLAELASRPAREIHAFIDQSPLLFDYESGRVSTDEFYSTLSKATGFHGSLLEFSERFADIFSPLPRMLDLVVAAQHAGRPTFVFSNTNPIAIEHIRRAYPFFHRFDGAILSYEVGAMKPAPSIYAEVERQTRCQGPELLYFDDRPENIQAALSRGWQAILHCTPELSWAAAARLGAVPLPVPTVG